MIDKVTKNDYFKAISPKFSAYVISSAGTGKTKILVDRILLLMLSGIPNKNILCLTFTNAAAIEMQERILVKLQAWQKNIQIEQSLLDMMPGPIPKKYVTYASKLLDNYCSSPIKIQTIHSFCQNILKYFP